MEKRYSFTFSNPKWKDALYYVRVDLASLMLELCITGILLTSYITHNIHRANLVFHYAYVICGRQKAMEAHYHNAGNSLRSQAWLDSQKQDVLVT